MCSCLFRGLILTLKVSAPANTGKQHLFAHFTLYYHLLRVQFQCMSASVWGNTYTLFVLNYSRVMSFVTNRQTIMWRNRFTDPPCDQICSWLFKFWLTLTWYFASPGIRRFTWRQSQVFPVWIDRLNYEVADWKDDVGIEPWTRDEASLWADSLTAANQVVYAAK